MRFIPTKVYGILDYTVGGFMAASPWLFGFAKKIYLPHLRMGVFEISAALLTNQQPEPEPEYNILDA